MTWSSASCRQPVVVLLAGATIPDSANLRARAGVRDPEPASFALTCWLVMNR
jgi:hypothetical protein